MALKATIYKATVNVADLDRNQFLDAGFLPDRGGLEAGTPDRVDPVVGQRIARRFPFRRSIAAGSCTLVSIAPRPAHLRPHPPFGKPQHQRAIGAVHGTGGLLAPQDLSDHPPPAAPPHRKHCLAPRNRPS